MTRNPMQRAGAAFLVLLSVTFQALLCRWLQAPWYCWALVWFGALKWVLILILDLPVTPTTERKP